MRSSLGLRIFFVYMMLGEDFHSPQFISIPSCFTIGKHEALIWNVEKNVIPFAVSPILVNFVP